MQSSLGLALRALVMLLCLVAVPFFATHGKSVLEFGKAVVDTYKARTQSPEKRDPKESAGDAPPFDQQTASVTPRADRPHAVLQVPAPWIHSGAAPAPLADWRQPVGSGSSAQPAGVQQASFDAPVAAPSGQSGPPIGEGTLVSTVPSERSNLGPGNAIAGSTLPPHDSTTGQPAASTDRFRRIEQRLRELGATYYLLETWGPNGDHYRFFCKMAIAGSGDYNRNKVFWAFETDPLQAMENVLQQVEQWRGGREP